MRSVLELHCTTSKFNSSIRKQKKSNCSTEWKHDAVVLATFVMMTSLLRQIKKNGKYMKEHEMSDKNGCFYTFN